MTGPLVYIPNAPKTEQLWDFSIREETTTRDADYLTELATTATATPLWRSTCVRTNAGMATTVPTTIRTTATEAVSE